MKTKKKSPRELQQYIEPEHVACAVASSLCLIYCNEERSLQMDGIEQAEEVIRQRGQDFTESGFLAITCVTCLEVGFGFEALTNPAYSLYNLFLSRGVDDVLKFLSVYVDNLQHPHKKTNMGLRKSQGFLVDRFFARTFVANEK